MSSTINVDKNSQLLGLLALWEKSITVTLVNGHSIKLTSEYSSLSPYVSTDPGPSFFLGNSYRESQLVNVQRICDYGVLT